MFVLQVAIVRGWGGITTAALNYARMLRAVGIDSAAAFRGPASAKLSDEGFDIIEAPILLTSPLASLPFALHDFSRRVLRRATGRPLMLIVHSDLALTPLRRLFPEACIVTPCHSDKFRRKRPADLIVTLNPAQHELVRRGWPEARVALLGNPYVAPAAEPVTGAGAPRLNFVGRFIGDKDPLLLLRAVTMMNGPKPSVRFIGAGPLKDELRSAAAGCGAEVVFAGRVPAPFATFHQSDILVLPSVWEGLPYTLLEALDRGVPTIASDIPGNSAAVDGGRFGALFECGNAAALAKAIEDALANLSELRARSRQGGEASRARYGAEPFWAALKRALPPDLRQEALSGGANSA